MTSLASRLPSPQVAAIVANELAERFAYYGSRSLLTLYLVDSLGFSESRAIAFISYYVSLSYVTPLLGGYLADATWGRFRTIVRFNGLYLVGLVTLSATAYDAVPPNVKSVGLYTGLAAVALGAGGIKANVAPFGAEQLSDPSAVTSFFFAFYAAINVGSLLAYATVPATRHAFGFGPAFTLTAAFFVASVAAFLSARRGYVHTPPTGSALASALRTVGCCRRKGDVAAQGEAKTWAHASPPPSPSLASRSPAAVVEPLQEELGERMSLISGAPAAGAQGWEEAEEAGRRDLAAIARLAPLFSMLIFFWSIYESNSTIWTLQARRMDLGLLQPENLQIINPLIIITLIPLLDRVVLPACERRAPAWAQPTPLRRLAFGMFGVAIAWIATGLLDSAIAAAPAGTRLSVAWQLPQYVILGISEICVSTTGIEFAYREAPPSAKGVVLALWYLTSSIGSLLNGLLYQAADGLLSQAQLVWVSCALMLLAATLFAVIASRFVPRERG
jgi:POT family proton-dependent oligopeptide transporter